MGCTTNKEYSFEIDVNDWKKYINILEANLDTQKYALCKSKHNIENLNELIYHFKNYETQAFTGKLFKDGKLVKAWLVYLWITHNLEYSNQEDTDTDEFEPNHFRKDKLNCSGYSSLFQYMCNQLDIECIQIFGYSKGFNYQLGDEFIKENHAWNAIKLEHNWYFVDSTWGSGYKQNGEFYAKFNPYWFLTPSQLLIYTHYTDEFKNQNTKSITLEKFTKLPRFYLNFHLLNLKCLSHDSFQINSNTNELFFEFLTPENVSLIGELHEKENNQFSEKIINTVFAQRDSKSLNSALLALIPEKNKTYKLCVYAKNTTTIKTFENVAVFLIKKSDDAIANENIPNYSLLFGNSIKCLSHGSLLINSKNEAFFIEFSAPKNLFLKASLRENIFGKKSVKVEDNLFVQRDSKSSNYAIIVLIPKIDIDYRLTILASDSNELFTEVGNFILKRTGPKQLVYLPKYTLEFSYGIQCLSHHSSVIDVYKSPFSIEFLVPLNRNFSAKLVDSTTMSDELSNSLLIQKDAKTLKQAIILLIPVLNRNYKLIIYANEASLNTLYEIGSFLLRVKRLKTNKTLPKYFLEYDLGLKCLSHRTSLIKSKKNPVNLYFSAPLTTLLTAKLKDSKNNEIDGTILIQRDFNQRNNFEIKVILPEKDYYYQLLVYATNKHDIDSLYKEVAEFKLISSNMGLDSKRFLKTYQKDLDSFIFSPLEYNLKVDVFYDFKFYIKDSLQVALVTDLDEKLDWFYLKSSSDSIWSLTKSFQIVGELKLLVKTIASGNSFEWFCSYMVSN